MINSHDYYLYLNSKVCEKAFTKILNTRKSTNIILVNILTQINRQIKEKSLLGVDQILLRSWILFFVETLLANFIVTSGVFRW